jgi:hypothetical protein
MNRHALTIAFITASLLGCQPGNQPAPSTMNSTTSPSEMSSSRTVSDEYFIAGVDRPGIYTFDGHPVTLLQAVVAVGGSHGTIQVTVDIIRHPGENPQFMRGISIKEILDAKRSDVILEPRDVINVLQQH